MEFSLRAIAGTILTVFIVYAWGRALLGIGRGLVLFVRQLRHNGE